MRLIALFALLVACPEVAEPPAEPPEPDPLPVVLQPAFEPLLPTWTVGWVPLGSDPYRAALADGTFVLPEEGTDDNGVIWFTRTPDEGGSLGDFGNGYVYAGAHFDTPRGTNLLVTTARGISVWVGDRPQPGNIYGNQNMPVPLVTEEGGNQVVVRAIGARGAVGVRVAETDQALWLNTMDLTHPDLVEGTSEELWLGVPVLNFTGGALHDATFKVVENEFLVATSSTVDALPEGAVTQAPFLLRPKAAWEHVDDRPIPVTLRAVGPEAEYEVTIELQTRPVGASFRRTFRSPVDGSIQYYGVVPPSDFDPARSYSVALTLHGAGVEAIGQANAYSARDWLYVVAATNRRPFGFDWEEWGRFNALATLDDAFASFDLDPTGVYLTGHSMGGHGSWHVMATTPGRFATTGPSAGWESFYTYPSPTPRPGGAYARARAHSDTLVYLENLADRGAYIIHGDADDNVPVSQGRTMRDAMLAVTPDVGYHEEPGAGHWWDGDEAPGADCVDWPPLFDFMAEHELDPLEPDFHFRSPSAAYSPQHSYVTLQSAIDSEQDLFLDSVDDGGLRLSTTNVRSLEIDGAGLRARGYTSVEVDGTDHDLPDGPLWVGPEDGKTAAVHGPYNQVYRRPFCYVYDAPGTEFHEYAAYLVSDWSLRGNGHACAVPLAELTDAIRAERNLIWVGVPQDEVEGLVGPFSWGDTIGMDGDTWEGAMLFVFPIAGRLDAVLTASAGSERLLFDSNPWSSRSGQPDYRLWGDSGTLRVGNFEADWSP